MNYTTSKELRRLITAAAQSRTRHAGVPYNQNVIDKWIEQRIQTAREQGLLLTDQQYSDFKNGRTLQRGDRARFIGATRKEKCRDGAVRTRKTGQIGTITAVTQDKETSIVTFTPEVGEDETDSVRLTVRENTPGYWALERLP